MSSPSIYTGPSTYSARRRCRPRCLLGHAQLDSDLGLGVVAGDQFERSMGARVADPAYPATNVGAGDGLPLRAVDRGARRVEAWILGGVDQHLMAHLFAVPVAVDVGETDLALADEERR